MKSNNNSEPLFSHDTILAVERCIKLNIPFALVLLPRHKTPRFYASMKFGISPVDKNGFFLPGFSASFFAENPDEAVYIPQDLKVKDILSIPCDFSPLESSIADFPHSSTEFMPYYAVVSQIIARHKRDNGKTVLSRVVRFDTSVPVMEVASNYFNSLDNCCRYLYFTPETGLWIGASPELLYEWNRETEIFRTMSLAGTRHSVGNTSWDEKNIDEHDYVTRHILSVMEQLGGREVTVDKCTSLKYGTIEHICENISGKISTPPAFVIEKLNPTPAVCGWPFETALKTIVENESHARNCYGGFISVCNGKTLRAFVNLRSAVIRPREDGNYTYAAYAGGGITKNSVPVDEWNEAASKIFKLYSCANSNNKLNDNLFAGKLTASLDNEFDKVINRS